MIRTMKDALRRMVFFVPSLVQRKRRVRELQSKRPTVSKAQLVNDLAALPVRRGATVLVHSSLKSLGYVDGGPATVVEALVEAFVTKNEGTVMLPTYSIDGTMHTTLTSGRIFDNRTTPSNLGAIPEALRRHPEAQRSTHPSHSFAAVGPDAGRLVAGHHTCGSSFGPGSPMYNLLESDGYLLGLGTDLGKVTFYHCLEDAEKDFPLHVFTADSPLTVECKDDDGQLCQLTLSAHDSAVSQTRIDRPENAAIRNFFTTRFETHAGMDWHPVGEARCWLIEARPMYAECQSLMRDGITIYSTAADLAGYQNGEAAQNLQGEETH